MNDERPAPRTTAAPWERDHEIRKELQALLAELEARLEAKEADWQRAGVIPAHATVDPLAERRSSR